MKNKLTINEWQEDPIAIGQSKEYGINIYSTDKNAIKDITKIVKDYKCLKDKRV